GCDTISPNDVAASWQSVSSSQTTLNSSLITPAAGDHLLVVIAVADQTNGTGSMNQSVANNGTGSATWSTAINNTASGLTFMAAWAIVTANGTDTYGVTYTHGYTVTTTMALVVGIAAFKASSG